MTYKTALQAIAISRHERATTSCQRTQQNLDFLFDACSEFWTEDGLQVFACTERGDEWTVTIEEVAP